MRTRLARVVSAVLGEHPTHILYVVVPTLLAVALDFALRARAILIYPPLELLNYFGSSLASAGFWGGPLWLASYLFAPAQGLAPGRRLAARAALGFVFLGFVLPFALFSYGGQVLYFHVFGAYMARDTVRLGIALRGTLQDWLTAWGGPFILVGLVLAALPVTLVIAVCVRRAAPSLRRTVPVLPILGWCVAATCFFTDFVESRSLQAAPPDTCFIHGVFHAVRDGLTGKGWVRRHGFTQRRPAPLPDIPRPAHRPNVLVVLTESVRADAVCSDPASCKDPELDSVVPDRIPLGTLVTQSSGTFSATMMLLTGLPVTADIAAAHQAPVLWEVARAVGYRTAYVTSQNLRYDDFGAFFEHAGIDHEVSALELGDTRNPHIGAPDELATADMLGFIRRSLVTQEEPRPYFGVLHLSNTHSPYRSDPALTPYLPESSDALGNLEAFHNHYRNSVAMQVRTLAAFLREVAALPGWDDTVVVYLSDHGEAFREHGRLYHINNLFDEEVRIPGWLSAGPRAMGDGARAALRAFGGYRTYSQDVHVTILDLLGAYEAHGGFPFASLVTGRSLLRVAEAPVMALMATETAVWEPDDAQYGVMTDDRLLVGSAAATWSCFDLRRDPGEREPVALGECESLREAGDRAFARVKR
jgi:arylsulfatase A-like enzyme